MGLREIDTPMPARTPDMTTAQRNAYNRVSAERTLAIIHQRQAEAAARGPVKRWLRQLVGL